MGSDPFTQITHKHFWGQTPFSFMRYWAAMTASSFLSASLDGAEHPLQKAGNIRLSLIN